MAIIIERMQQARGTAAEWTSSNPTLMAGEIGWESDTGYFKIGDGSTAWNSLHYSSGRPILASGTATLVAGVKAVTGLTSATANTIVRVWHKTIGGTPGALFTSVHTAGTGFTIKSTSTTDTSTVYYEVLAW